MITDTQPTVRYETRGRSSWAPVNFGCQASDTGNADLWPSQHIPGRLAAARAKCAEYLEHEVGNQ